MPNPITVKPSAEKAEMFRRLKTLKADLLQDRCNLHEQVIALIIACLDEGLSAGPEIVGTISHLGFNPRHVGMQLNEGIGHMWQRDGERVYRVLTVIAGD